MVSVLIAAALLLGPKQVGFNFQGTFRGAHSPDASGTPRDQQAYNRVRSTGGNWISLNVWFFQKDIDSTDMAIDRPVKLPDGKTLILTPSDQDLRTAIRRAKRDGLKVMLKPYVETEAYLAEPSKWHGLIGSGFKDENQWKRWFQSYTAAIVHYARLAQSTGVDQFCVGTELVATDHREADWRRLIGEVRRVFDGPVTYASHHPQLEKIAWWDALDVVGVDAYFPLTNLQNPSRNDLVRGWAPHLSVLERVSKRTSKAILFTEIGYPAISSAASEPWLAAPERPADPNLQALCYDVLFDHVLALPYVSGAFLWVAYWNLDLKDEKGFVPFGKPAEKVIRLGFGKWSEQPSGRADNGHLSGSTASRGHN